MLSGFVIFVYNHIFSFGGGVSMGDGVGQQ
jgi:hypothetical protein